MTQRILTGVQPSGALHIGNYFGAMKPMIDFMNNTEDEVFVMIPDYHALTSLHDAKQLRENVKNVILDWLAIGLNPEKVTFYVQSDIPEVQELTWLLHTVCPMGLLNRATSYRDKVENGIDATSALFSYPVLMAADILIIGANIVPVGKDQKQHLEMARDLAQKFNNTYGELFPIPEVQISEDVAIVPGLDGRKMSKSYGNTVPLFAEESVIRKRIMSIETDSADVKASKNPDTCNVFALYKLFATKPEQAALARRYSAGGMGYGDAKQELFDKMKSYFAPMWAKRKELELEEDLVVRIREMGAEKMRRVARKFLQKARRKTGLE